MRIKVKVKVKVKVKIKICVSEEFSKKLTDPSHRKASLLMTVNLTVWWEEESTISLQGAFIHQNNADNS